jgi:phospholipid/cholesterol/gamma-HCH transport system ATP-binding protein
MNAQQATDRGDAVVRVRDLTSRYGERTVYRAVELAAYRGEVLAIAGGSGSGKSTLLREMAMLKAPTAGSITLFGREISGIGEATAMALRRRIGVLFQFGALFSGLSVLDNVAMPLREHTDLSDGLITEIAAVKIALAGLPPDAGLLYPSQLSGGMRKRAGLARAIALDPQLLFLDEPTSGLDPAGADALDELVAQLKNVLGLTVVMVTHDMDSLWRLADRVVVLGRGRVLGSGSAPALAASGDPDLAGFFQGPRGRAARRSQP